MSEPWLSALRSQYQEDPGPPGGCPPDPNGREAIKRDIIALFKRVDGALTDLGQLKEDIRTLVDRYKQASAAAGAAARVRRRRPSSPGRAPRSMPTISAPPPSSRRAGA